ncbi:hypothetical protein HPE56_04875 [Maribacter sp. ANRC-HE7]|uniref:Uncharacterized protein n=1 Tax=Maribacter aquimaris TaxID=2737171 RepID=A0ABR7V090_9FLAO|nr:hypothetical protein [Maribacter aquimaris]MBD0777121.1 hypothetical protein [Maribacter aquimaris]
MKKGTDFHKASKDVHDMGMNIAESSDTSFDKKIYVHKNHTIAVSKCWDEKHGNFGIFNRNNLKMNSNQYFKST